MKLQHLIGLTSLALATTACVAGVSTRTGTTAQESDWLAAETGLLENHVQLTSSDFFRKAGECYFSPDGRQIIFQAVEKKANPDEEERFYQMYVADLIFEEGRVTGSENIKRLSPPGSSSTCGWFHPTEPGVVVFGCTIVPPQNPDKTGYQRESSRYSWQFPQEMDIVRCEIAKASGLVMMLPVMCAMGRLKMQRGSAGDASKAVSNATPRILGKHIVSSWTREVSALVELGDAGRRVVRPNSGCPAPGRMRRLAFP